jgi:predicted  nucleic acid-binding Zn-ribbon protein
MPNLDELISTAQNVVTDLNKKLLQIEEIHQDIKRLRDSSSSIPEQFNKKFKEIVDLTSNYTNTLGGVTKTYLDGNNTLFTSKINDLSNKIKEIEKEISRLVNTDFNKLFTDLQKKFIDQTREDLEKELKRFEDKSKDLQNKINELRKQVDRIESIDLVYHFDKLQKTLAEIFGAINAINLSLTTIIQTLTGIVQSIGTIQTTIDTNYKEAKQLLSNYSETSEKHLTNQDNQAKNNVELLEIKIKSVSEQNELLREEVKTNRIIQIVGLTIILIILIYVAVK